MENNNIVFLENEVYEPYKANIEWVEPIEPKELNKFEIEMLKSSKNPKQLLEEESNEKPEELDEEQKLKRIKKEYITKVKVIALDKMGKFPLTNPSYFSQKEKKQLISLMEEVMKQSEEDITLIFNEVCNEKIFSPEADYSTFPVYKELV